MKTGNTKKIVLLLFIVLPISLYSQWVRKADFPDSRTFVSAFSIGNYGYVGGGMLDKKDVRDFWRYDSETDIWEPIDSIPVTGKIADAAGFVINGKAYFCNINQLWEYNPETGNWTRKADPPAHYSVYGFSMTGFSIGNYGYLFAGNDLYPGDASNIFYQYDPETDTWSEKETCPVVRIINMVSFSLKGKGYIGTGLTQSSEEQKEFWEYNPELNEWSRIADFPGASRVGAVAFSIGNYAYVGSGQKNEEITAKTVTASDFWRHDPEGDVWEQVDTIEYNTSGAFAFTINGKGYVGGGGGQKGEFWEYTPSNTPLKVDAGNDIIVCPLAEVEFVLGGNPSASGGVPPYTCTWSGKHFDLKFPAGIPSWIYASDILNDTTKSNPTIAEWRNVSDEWTTYYLKVEDASGNIQYDSVKIIKSYFLVKTIYILPDTIYRGDSVQFFGDIYFESNFLPIVEYTFSPSHGLSDSTDIFGWAKPDTSITYYLEAVNSAGCRSGKIEYWHIEVIDTTAVQQNKLVQEGKLWSNTKAGTENIYNYRSYWIKFQGDTLINALVYKKVLQADDSLHSDWYVNGFIREEVANQKVYLYDKYRNEDMLLYDFRLEQGDSILTGDGEFFAKVDSVIYETFGNSTDTLKQIYFESGGVWIEGIGSLWGVLEGLNAFFITGEITELVCYYENDNLVYHNPDFKTCFPDSTSVSISIFGNKKNTEIFPNPARDKITIYSPGSRILEVEIYDLAGTCFYRKLNIETNQIDLNTDNFPKGMYVLKIRDERDKISRKIVIQ